MKSLTRIAAFMVLAGGVSGTAMAKDLYVSAKGNDSNDGLTAATAKKTLTALDAIIEHEDVVHISGMLSMSDEIPDGFDPGVGIGGGALNDAGGVYVSHDNGKKLGFNISSRGSKNWLGITFVGEDPETDGFSGDGKWGLFILRGKEKGGTTFKNLGFVDGISNLDGGVIYTKDEAIVNFINCRFVNNHPDWEKTYKPDGNAWKPSGNASEKAGALRIESNSVINIDGCWFEKNINRHGGAICITGTANGIVNTGGVNIKNTTFYDNSAWCFDNEEEYLDNSQGGAIELWSMNSDCYLNIDHCVFEANKTWNNAGAIFIYDNIKYGRYSDINVTNSAFMYNESERGGAVQLSNFADGPMEDKDYLTKTKHVKFANCIFQGNIARTDGGAFLYWGAHTDGVKPNNPKDELWMVNCTMIGNSTNGNAGHGAGYKEMSRSGSSEAYSKIGNADRHFYNNVFESNFANESNELADFTTGEPFGHYMDNNFFGRLVIINDECKPEELINGLVNDGEGSTTITFGYSGEQIGENEYKIAGDEVAAGVYDMSYGMVPGIALPDDSELKTAGDTKWLKLADREVEIPGKAGSFVTRSGYDIAATDGLGFERPEGTCAVGAAEYDAATITEYLDGSKDLPYVTNAVGTIFDNAVRNNIKISGNVITADGSDIQVYTLAGVCVARGHNAVNINSLSNGVYVVKAGASVVKIAK